MATFRSFVLLSSMIVYTCIAASCSGGNQLECASSYCPNYAYANNTCGLVPTRTCLIGQIYTNNVCMTCRFLPQSSCTVFCPDHLWTTFNGSTACHPCYSIYGQQCIKCTSNICTACSFTSGAVLALDSKSCVIPNCLVSNCIQCYSRGSKCYRCVLGYMVTSNYTCAVSTCSIANCLLCSGSIWGNCFPGYSPSSDGLDCLPVCQDIYCTNCIGPGVCGTCLSAYQPDVNGICQIDCTQISIANCIKCKTTTSCSACATGFTPVQDGSQCQQTCSVANCQLCPTNMSTCQVCRTGYELTTSSTCQASFCQIPYCATCATVSTCSACVSGFSLVDSGTCMTRCPVLRIYNCLLCSETNCTVCMANYVLTNGSCVLPCASIVNCIACISPTLCASCAQGYALSADYKTCSMVCLVQGCLSCPSSTSLNCDTCSSGYIRYTNPNPRLGQFKCALTCPEGTVQIFSGGSSNCQQCSVSVPQCSRCSLVGSVVTCLQCLNGYFINGNICDLCSTAITNCLTCDTATHCIHCVENYVNTHGICDDGICNSDVMYCAACLFTAPSTCVICKPDYKLVNNLCTAVNCANSFIFDLTSESCVCPPSTYESTQICVPCNEKCTNCTVSVCYVCAQGYYPVGSSCLACIDNCQSCKIGSSCQVCQTGFYLYSNGLCLSSNQDSTATLAFNGYSLMLCYGCASCIASSIGSTGSQCTKASNGYTIIGGIVVKCHPKCLSCASYLVSICTSCYPGSVLKSGTCVSCVDPNALICSSLDPSYALVCRQGYTGGAYSTSSAITGGTCQPCASFCSSCFFNGPGQCDSNGCTKGTVQITGTTNCTKCFGGCVKCAQGDPNVCLDCGARRYMNGGGSCMSCPAGCQGCTSATVCSSCTQGYYLFNSTCLALPSFCYSRNINQTGDCMGCFAGYKLSYPSNPCSPDLTCSAEQTCIACPQGYILSGGVCLQCTLTANCIACNPSNESQCHKCQPGYYLDVSHNCQPCSSNCLACDSASFCFQAAPGFYIVLAADDAYSGAIGQCYHLCATCTDTDKFCLSCVSGYTLQGTVCVQDFYLALNIVLGPATTNSIFFSTVVANQQLHDSITSVNRICNHFVTILPAAFFRVGNQTCFDLYNIDSMTVGSVIFDAKLNAGTHTVNNVASSAFTSAVTLASHDGFSLLSFSVSAVGGQSGTDPPQSSSNLGLILGLSLSLTLLLVLIVVLVVVKCCRQNNQQPEYPPNNEEQAPPEKPDPKPEYKLSNGTFSFISGTEQDGVDSAKT